MEKLHVYADKAIMQVVSFNGHFVTVKDIAGWSVEIPVTRVERFCDSEGNHINYNL